MKSVLILALFFGVCMSGYSQNTCKTDIVSTVKEVSPNNYTIHLKSNENRSVETLELYDLYEGKVLETKQLNKSLRSGLDAFLKVKPSLYVVYVKQEGCSTKVGIGGIQGIKVGKIQ